MGAARERGRHLRKGRRNGGRYGPDHRRPDHAVTANFNGTINVSGSVTQSTGTGTTTFSGGGNIGGGLNVTTNAITVQTRRWPSRDRSD